MLRLGAIFIVLCMVVIAACAGAGVYLLAGLRATDSVIVAIAVLTGLAIYNSVSTRMSDRADLSAQIADLSRGTGDLARQLAELARQVAELEDDQGKSLDRAAEKARAASEPIATELSELSTLVKQLAETVALHELKFAGTSDFAMSAAASSTAESRADAAQLAPARPSPAVAASEKRSAMIELVRAALDANRIDLYLQPIVTLPQRKVRYYEAFTRLRTGDGTVVNPPDFLEAAESAGLMPAIDKMLLLRSVQVLRRLQLKHRDIGLFCNLSPTTLSESKLFPEILQFMEANRALAQSLVLEFQQSTLGALGPMETESVAALQDLGFRFCMDRVADLRMEPRRIGERGIRYVKAPATLLLGEAASLGSDIHAADLSDLLGRYGITLIAERIEAEAQVIGLLEYDVRFGQGYLFSQPRPVRADVMRADAEPATPDSAGIGETRKLAASGSGAAL